MAIVTPLMRKFMYSDDELDTLTGKAHALFEQHFHEKVANNREFSHPTPKDKLSLSFQYRGLHPHDNKIEVSPEKRKPLSTPGPNSLCWQQKTQTQPGDDSAQEEREFDLHDDFDYRYDLVTEEDGDAALDEAARLFGEPPGRFDSKGRYILYRPQSASSPPPTRDATLSYTKPPSPSTRSTRGGSPGAGRSRSRFAQSLDSSLHPLPWGFGARSAASQRPLSATAGEFLGGASMFGSPSSRDASLPSIPSPAQAPGRPASRGNPSIKFMRYRRIKREAESSALYTQVFQEAALMQRKFLSCVREANVFAQSLGRRVVYRVIERDPLEDAAWETILQGNNPRLRAAAIPPGTGKRIEKTLVEVTEEGRDVRYLGTTHFFREHSRLQIEVSRLLSVRPKVPISDPDVEEARIRAAALAAEEAAAAGQGQGHRDHHAHAKPAHGLPPHAHAPSPATTTTPSLRPPRAVIEAKLHEVLLLETEKLLRLKAQLRHMDKIGWNNSLEAVRASVGTPY